MSSQSTLGKWYRKTLGEPLEEDHVYGYWAFLLGVLLGLVGLGVYLYSAVAYAAQLDLGGGPSWTLRALAGSAAMVGGALVIYAVVLLLPLRRRAARIAGLGLVVCLAAVGLFNLYYPSNWYWAGADPDRSPLVMGVYGLGYLLMVVAIFLFPLAKSDPIDGSAPVPDEQIGRTIPEEPPDSKARFELFEDKAGEWRWRLVHDNGNIIADGGEGYASKQKAKQGLESVQRNAPGADTETIETAEADEQRDDEGAVAGADDEPAATDQMPASDGSSARFETYVDKAGEWRWRLRHRNGNIIADGGEGYVSRSGIENAVERIREYAPDADTLDYEPAAYELFEDRAGEYRWRLRHKNGRILADGGEGYASRSNARKGIESVREHAVDEDHFEVYEDNAGEYRWRLVASNGELIADSGQGYSRRSSAENAVERIQAYAPEADTLEYDPTAYELYEDRGGEYRWRLRHKNGNVLATGSEGYASKQKAKQGMQSVIGNAADADAIDLEADGE